MDNNDYLDSRLAAELAANEVHQHELQQSAPPESESGSGKRKAEDGQSGGSRAKRNRYISIACNECKRYGDIHVESCMCDAY